MKTAVVGLLCFLVAFVLGRLGPQAELQTRELQLQALKEALAERDSNRRALAGVTGMLQLDQGASRRAPAPVEPPPAPDDPAPEGSDEPPEEPPEPATEDVPSGMEERIDNAVELWKSRSRLARAGFLSNIEADQATAARFDTLVGAMNLRIEDRIAQWVDGIAERGQARPEDGARLMHELTGAVVFTYDELDNSLPENWRDQAGREFQLFDFVDPDAGRALLRIEDLMDDVEGGPRF